MTVDIIAKYPLLSAISMIFLTGACTWLFNEWRFQKRLNWKQTIDALTAKLDDLANLIENLFKKYGGHEKRIDEIEKDYAEAKSAVMARIDAVEERCELHREFTRMNLKPHRAEDPPDSNFADIRQGDNEKDGTDAT